MPDVYLAMSITFPLIHLFLFDFLPKKLLKDNVKFIAYLIGVNFALIQIIKIFLTRKYAIQTQLEVCRAHFHTNILSAKYQ